MVLVLLLIETNEGDIVLLKAEGQRCNWPLGKILKIIKDPDGIVRSVEVLSQGKISLRTIEKLIPLEVSDRSEFDTDDNVDVGEDSQDLGAVGLEAPPVNSGVRPKRTAATKADLMRKELIAQGSL